MSALCSVGLAPSYFGQGQEGRGWRPGQASFDLLHARPLVQGNHACAPSNAQNDPLNVLTHWKLDKLSQPAGKMRLR